MKCDINISECLCKWFLQNVYNMTNTNFYQVEVQSVTASLLDIQRILVTVTNDTALTIPMRSTKLYHVMLNVTFSSDMDYVVYVAAYLSNTIQLFLCFLQLNH